MTDAERDRKFKAERRRQLKRKTRIQRNTAAEITRLLKAAEQKTREALAGAPSEWEQFYLPQLQRSVRGALAEFGEQAGAAVSTAAGQSWQAGIDLVDAPVGAGGIRLAGVLPAINTGQLQAMRTFMTDKMADVGVSVANRINSELGLVAIGAQSQGDAIGRISQLVKGGRSRAITITRTELGRTYAVATQKRLDQARAVVPGMKKQWRRSGKLRDRIHHTSIDGQIREVDEPFRLGNGVELLHPRHPAAPVGEVVNCGCESLPYMDSWAENGALANPDRKPFSPEEIAADPFKRGLQTERDLRSTPTFSGKKLDLDDMIKAGRAEVDEVLGGASAMSHEQFKRRLMERLGQRRSLGRAAAIANGGKAAQLVKEASLNFPDEWVAAADDAGPLYTKAVKGRALHYSFPQSGYFNLKYFGATHVKKGGGYIAAGDPSNALHEYAHRLQHTLPGLDDYFQNLHVRRTQGDPLERLRDITDLNYKAHEVARKDGYSNPYFGKEYKLPEPYYSGIQGALEVMTMSFQTVLSPKRRLDFDRLLSKDREIVDLTVGLLFNYAP